MTTSLYPDNPILMIDDEEHFLKSASFALRSQGINNIILCNNSKEALLLLNKQQYSFIFLDLLMPEISGEELLKKIITLLPDTPVIILTADIKLEKAVECIRLGAYDYIVKPVDKNKLLTVVRNMIRIKEINDENKLLRKQIVDSNKEIFNVFAEIVTNNIKMKSIFQYAYAISKSSLPVLITGETGTGKELLAKIIHQISERKGKFVELNIAGVDYTMISDTLFGHKKGSFTGSIEDRKGFIELASGGTLFLDEIGDLDLNSQVKLLRVLQERKYYPIGSDNEEIADVRFIFATNQDIKKILDENRLRSDLYYRLQSHHIHMPPLRERLDDIPLLVDYFLDKAVKNLNKKIPDYPKELISLLQSYDFPGNIRELEGMIFDAMSRSMDDKHLSLELFYEKISFSKEKSLKFNKKDTVNTTDTILALNDKDFLTLKDMENLWIDKALKESNGNQTKASKLLGISRRALNNRLSRNKKKKK